jgi:hypothetical protein
MSSRLTTSALRLRSATVFFAALLALERGHALAESVSSGDAEVRRGIAAFGAGLFDEAIREMRLVSGKPGAPALRARAYLYIGLAQVSQGGEKERDADLSFRRALELDPTIVVDAARFPPRLVGAFTRVRQTIRGKLRVLCDGAGAEVEVRGESRGVCGDEFELVIGAHQVRAVQKGEASAWVPVVVRPFRRNEARVVVPRASAAAAALPTPALQTKPVERETKSSWRRTLAWSLVAAGGAALATGIVFGVLSRGSIDDFNAKKTAGQTSESDLVVIEGRASTEATVANVFFVASGVAAVSGVVLLLVGDKSRAEKTRAAFEGVIVRPGLDAAGSVVPVAEARWKF